MYNYVRYIGCLALALECVLHGRVRISVFMTVCVCGGGGGGGVSNNRLVLAKTIHTGLSSVLSSVYKP